MGAVFRWSRINARTIRVSGGLWDYISLDDGGRKGRLWKYMFPVGNDFRFLARVEAFFVVFAGVPGVKGETTTFTF